MYHFTFIDEASAENEQEHKLKQENASEEAPKIVERKNTHLKKAFRLLLYELRKDNLSDDIGKN